MDPLSHKYPNLSPYTYCANNPVRLVDEDGAEIGDFFDYNGCYLGTDGIDDGKIYITTQEDWDNCIRRQVNAENISYYLFFIILQHCLRTKKIVVQKAYCIDEALSLSKENEIDRILCSGGCDMRLYFVINISGKIDEFIDSEAPCLSPSMFIKCFL